VDVAYAKFGANRTNRFEVIQFLVNFSFLLAAIHHGLEKIIIDPSAVSAESDEAPCQIWGESDQQLGSYSGFVNFKMAAGGHLVFHIS